MNHSRWIRNAVLALLLVIGATALFVVWQHALGNLSKPHWGARTPDIPTPPPTWTPNTGAALELLTRPVFWQSRRPAARPATAEAESGPLELLGILVEGNERLALMRIKSDKGDTPARRLRKGETIGRFALMRIDTEEVTLSTPDGITQSLKLKRGHTPLPEQPHPAAR
ncbi:MAG: hypothetical protein ACOZAP_08465 [Pseudomonadota bacterium]|jgi:hypothetical protein